MEADLLPRHVLVVNIGAVAERLAVQGAHAVELAALIVFAVVSPRQHRAADQLQRGRARLGGDDLNGAIVDHLQAADVGGGAVFILGATTDVRRRDIGVAVIGRIVQQRQGKGDIVGFQRRAVAVEQIRPQLDGVGQIIGADLPDCAVRPSGLPRLSSRSGG